MNMLSSEVFGSAWIYNVCDLFHIDFVKYP